MRSRLPTNLEGKRAYDCSADYTRRSNYDDFHVDFLFLARGRCTSVKRSRGESFLLAPFSLRPFRLDLLASAPSG